MLKHRVTSLKHCVLRVVCAGECEDSYGYGGTGTFSHDMKFSKYAQHFGKGDVIMALIDLDQREPVISYCKNGTPLGECRGGRRWGDRWGWRRQ